MDTTLGSLEASYLLWDNVWRKDSSTFTELNILDVVQLSPAGGVIGWLFTSSNGTVKSKLAANWRIEAILNRCGYLENDCIAHHYNSNMKRWMCVVDPDAMQDTLSQKSSARTAVIIHPQLTRSSTFMEVVCTKTSSKEGRVEIPQYTNAWLCDLSNRGTKGKSDGLPTQSITCKDKESNQLSREYVATIVKFLEANLRIKISSITAIVMFETTASRSTTKAATNTGANHKNNANATLTTANILNTDARVVRLHHIAGMTYRSALSNSQNVGFGSDNTVNSTIAESLGLSMASKSAARVDCCHGDFCEYAAADEAAEGGGLGGGTAFDLDDFGDADFDIKHESLKAVNRHRALKKGDPFQKIAEEEGIDDDEHGGAEKMDLYPGQTDHLIAHKKEQKKMTAMSDFVAENGSTKNATFTNFSSNESLRSKQASLLTSKTKKISEQVKRTEKKLKVMAKSVALARQEMAEIEHRDIHNLNSDLSPNSKSHRSSAHSSYKSQTQPDPPSPVHSGSGGHSKVWPPALTKWWLSVGRNLPKNSLSVMVPSSSAHAISKVVLGIQTEKAELASHGSSFAGAGLANDRIDDGPVEQANSLYFSWYYNPVRVCERCHKVYTELDRQRKMRFKHLMRQQRARVDKSEDDSQKWREIEARIFKQRQFVSRLAKQDAPHQTPHHSQQNSLYQQQFAQYSSQYEGLPGSNSLAFDSVVEPSGGVAFGRAYKLSTVQGSQQGSAQQGPSLVPSKALPPVPWGLNQEGRSEAIRNNNSILTRRILQKAPDQVHSLRGQGGGRTLSGDSDTDAVLAQWRQLTRDRGNDEEAQYKPRKAPKPVKKVGAPFNSDRLLHPWQREMNAMKNKIRNGEDPNAPDKKYPESKADEYDLYGDSIDDGYEYDPNDPSNAANYSTGQGFGSGYHYGDDQEEEDAEDAGVFGTIPVRNVHSAEMYHHNMLQAPPPQRLQALSAGHNPKKKSIETKAAKVQGAKNLPKGGVLPSLSQPVAAVKLHGSQSTSALVPRTRSEKLKSIDASWGELRSNSDDSKERPTTSGPNSPTARRSRDSDSGASSGAFGSPLVDKNRSAGALSAVNRVNNALIGGMSQNFNGNGSFRLGTSESIPEHGEGLDDEEYESPQRSPVKSMHNAGARASAGGGGRPPAGKAGPSRREDSSDDGGEDEDDDDDDDDEEIGWSPFTITA